MSDWKNDSSWSGAGAAAATSSSWDAGVPLSSDWDAGTKALNAHDTKFDAGENVETNGDYDNSMDNAGGGGDDRACHICQQTGHLARECPQKPEGFGKCFNCGEEG
ncbi:MAG: hypothetical protein Q9198_007755 [Flavoplaca austrocitrina]